MTPPKPSNPERLGPAVPEREIHTGSIYLYLVGPGPDSMRRCSRRSMTPGTPEERALAERALAILNERHRENREAGAFEILAALVECGYEEEA